MEGLQILNIMQISRRINRMAYQVYEVNFNEDTIILAGIAHRGYALAGMMQEKLREITGKDVRLVKLTIDKGNPVESEVELDTDLQELTNKVVILVDDVVNTGKTLFYATKPFQKVLLKKLEILVLVHRDHLEFPFRPDYTGLSLATTLREHITVKLEGEEQAVYLS